MNIEQERLHGFGSYLSIRCTTIAVLFHLFHSPVALPFHPIQGKGQERLHDAEHFFRRRISPFKSDIIRLEAGAFKFLRNRLFMTSMQLPRKMSRSLL
jgi:hypothetical protein